jgi:Protein of unknown function (DUF1553)/Protein of unknown function (DUF1549)/Planctomycete cytochrome C
MVYHSFGVISNALQAIPTDVTIKMAILCASKSYIYIPVLHSFRLPFRMSLLRYKKLLITLVLVVSGAVLFLSAVKSDTIDFNTQVKPIFNKKCITCHGGVKRQSGFSLLFRTDAMAKNESGKPAIIPGSPDKSEMIRRLTLKDPEERMPYKHEALSSDDIEVLRKWIKQGAVWGDHWAFVPVTKTAVPDVKNTWAKNEIDYFIYDKLKKEEVAPSTEAAKADLLRRVSLDLIGKPADESLAKQFLQNNASNAYEQLVDSLLASEHYGERWTTLWMDLARYADSKGYEADNIRSIWRYRDWLIHAFNDDKPYGQFLTEQLAGDLLPDPSKQQLIATAFHRNTLTNDEGGTDNEEFRTSAVVDRVNTTWEGLMSTTFGCVQCHSHPYDPFRHDEYYKFMAFFNDTRDEDTYDEYPVLREFSGEDSIQLISLLDWIKENISPKKEVEIKKLITTWQPSVNSLLADEFINAQLDNTNLGLRKHGSARLQHINLEQKTSLVLQYNNILANGILTIYLDKLGGNVLTKLSTGPVTGWKVSVFDLPATSGVHDLYLLYDNPALKNKLDLGIQFDWLSFTSAFPGKGLPGYASNKQIYEKLLSGKRPGTPIMMENPADQHRKTFVFERGNWLMKGKEVQADVPHSLNPFPANAPRNRLGLAMWITDKKNPLTARTMVNRLWEQLFGSGLVETLEDMGTQGAIPTHKELLDYLSWKFMNDYNWSMKQLLKEIVLSATYRQDSKVTPLLLNKDPYNKLYAHGPRIRLTSEQVRDQALSAAGVLSNKMYGPGVMPWQPDGMWNSPYNGLQWITSEGEDQYRRSLYTFWKRTSPYPSMIAFDGPMRVSCTARRIRTNTPLQALVTLNDPVYAEAARLFAYRMQQAAPDVKQQIAKGYEILTYKAIPAAKLAALEELYNTTFAKLKNDAAKTCDIIGVQDKHNNPETASLVLVAGALLNLDEVISKK